jgi:ABC-type transport system involved in multi-copper enzyme maturation permease subunit
VSFFAVQLIVRAKDQQHTLGDPHALRVVVGAALFLTVLGALAVGIGALVRNTAAGISLFVFLIFVLPGLMGILPNAIADNVSRFLPLNAGSALATSTFEPGPHLSPWTGFAVFCGYTLVVLGAAAVTLLRRDA